MNHQDIRQRLTGIFRDLFANDDLVLVPELNADAVPGWDSLKQISLIVAVEEEFDLRFTTREVDALQNVGDLEAAIGRKTSG